MADAGVRIALLARAGKARDQLHAALDEAGASIVAEGDPSELQPEQVAAAKPNYFLVSLEAATEAALERFDDLLAQPGVEVMYDDAEVTAGLDGWDLNRWARHLASKLLGAGDALPPAPADAPAWVEGREPPVDDPGLDLDLSMLDVGELGSTLPEASAPTHDFGELDFDESIGFSQFNPADATPAELDVDVAELSAQLEAFDQRDSRFLDEHDLPSLQTRQSVDQMIAAVGVQGIEEIEAIEAVAPTAAQGRPAASAPAPSFDFSNLELAPMESAPAAVAVAAPAIRELSLAEADAGVDAGLGAVAIFAGLGGPDAVRQLLSSLPEQLPVPVLLYQHLEVGKHERLVDQLAKISKLPVQLARAGSRPEAGKVSLLPAGLSAQADGEHLLFGPGSLAQLLAALAPQDSMVVVLSGADEQLVPAILAVRDAGGQVFAQDPDVCFDAAAAEAMKRQGAPVHPALGLARQVAARWPA